MTEVDRDAIVDTALELFVVHGFYPTTLADIAAELDVAPDALAASFPDKESFVFAVVDDLFGAILADLAASPESEDLVEGLRTAHQNTVARVVAGDGPVPLHRMQRMGRVIAANPSVAQAVSVRRKQVLGCGLADQRGVGHDDPKIARAVTVWSAVMACTHAAAAHDEPDLTPQADRFSTDNTTHRLNLTFNLVRGSASADAPPQGLPLRPYW
ncbi:AcrR family transcriptional regulator [Mycolicibacterium sp. BK556]|uniref:TetR/AcrR family transcriptional regulator n=1 Tax=Mycobacteriaceae TaxID=1762 RepID=UPI00105FF518|nr:MULTISPECIES: TetR/AcrR family transcriptional regulator [Mycobacteriaceae]MBB3604353.1 AcrR family transcriptional regulator [Mycolicibacterium sp. BK556]MBB3634934.1 AcrR family transcriptional regulator [Mycolicibacterium sp. BK607]MBB3752798.1 AcrR family transcriptional regulator [Mycolicibacterium sp. BK634]TDO17265.1 TetR family transcriptional regulator [Mycobacterium sp. BK086]